MYYYLLVALCAAFGFCVCLWAGAFASMQWLWLLPLSGLGCFLAVAAVVFLVILAACALVDLDHPRLRYSKFFQFLIHVVADVCFPALGVRIHTRGLDLIPKSGRYLLVSNHLHEIDPAVFHRYFRRGELAFIGKKETRNMFLVNKVMHATLSQFIDRENDREALKTILKCISLIKEDQCSVAVFPEGGINDAVRLHDFRPGVFKIAQKAQVPIVVCTVQGTNRVIPNVLHLKGSRVDMHVLGVIQPQEHLQLKTPELASRIYAMMYEDLPAEYRPLED